MHGYTDQKGTETWAREWKRLGLLIPSILWETLCLSASIVYRHRCGDPNECLARIEIEVARTRPAANFLRLCWKLRRLCFYSLLFRQIETVSFAVNKLRHGAMQLSRLCLTACLFYLFLFRSLSRATAAYPLRRD